MKRYGNLYPQITDFGNLLSASRKAMLGHKAKPAEARFFFNLENELIKLQEELLTHTYQPRHYRVFFIREPKLRQICAAPVRDRVVHHAVCNVVGEIWDKSLIDDTFACRVGKGTHAAVARAQTFAHRFKYFLKCDIRRYFETLDHQVLKEIIRRKVKDRELLSLLDAIIDQPLAGSDAGKGVPIGNLTSQYFANLYLGKLDRFVKEKLRVRGFLRYMDDFILFAESRQVLREWQNAIIGFVNSELAVELKENSIVAPCRCGLSFLGFRVFPNNLRLCGAKWRRLRRKIALREKAFLAGKITETELADSARSMVAHISKADTLAARQKLIANTAMRISNCFFCRIVSAKKRFFARSARILACMSAKARKRRFKKIVLVRRERLLDCFAILHAGMRALPAMTFLVIKKSLAENIFDKTFC